ncbi:hypothetical protein PF008_g28200 [Phytophthora fragariae]|uniref:Pentacotripeptide-repeat region of PRORP domain-containing protein n=1 Tax=Phytophthora fragariae TaxID=53985 RepID=A0A6G0QC54_9STRA|nr:hypothetical protein PF008_g28200 [Phytophthora fragariae]
MSILDDMKRNADLSKTPTAVFPLAVEAAELTNENQFNEVKDDNMYGRVVGAACQAKQHELVCEILDYMHANGVDCTKYKHQIRSLHKAGLHDRLQSVFESMRKEGCVCDEEMYGTAVDSAIRVKNRDLAMSILDDMQRDAGLSKTPTAIFTRAVGVAVLTNQHQLALDVFDFMARTDIDASTAYVTATRTAFKSKQYDFVFDILRKMTENGVDASELYSQVVMSFTKLKYYDQVLRAFKGMRECGYEGGEDIVKIAVHAAIKTDRHDDIMAICNHDGRQYTSALVAAVRLKQKKQESLAKPNNTSLCVKYWTTCMQTASTVLAHPTEEYKHQLMSLHKAGLHDRLQSVFEAMRKAGCVSDEDTYETAVDSAIRVKNRELLISILDDMKCNASLSRTPTAVFHRAVGVAVWTNQPQLLFDVFDFMDHTDTATSAVYTSGIRSAFKAKQYDFVFDILRKMTENGVDASGEYSHAVMSFSKLECYDQVLRAFKAMRELGYGQEKVLCTTALRAATELDRHDDVIAICNGLSGKPSVTTPLHSHALEQAHSTNKQGLVDSILQRIKKFTTGVE